MPPFANDYTDAVARSFFSVWNYDESLRQCAVVWKTRQLSDRLILRKFGLGLGLVSVFDLEMVTSVARLTAVQWVCPGADWLFKPALAN